MRTLFSVLNPILHHIAISLCFLPILLLSWKKIAKDKAYLFICIYWFVNGLFGLPYFFEMGRTEAVQNQLTLIYNLIDAPLITIFFYFAAPAKFRKALLYILVFFLVFESLCVMLKGHNYGSSTIIVGIGGAFALIYSGWMVTRYFHQVEHTPQENALGYSFVGLVFNYGLFVVIYIFNYIKFTKETVPENLLLYYVSVILGTLLCSIGLWQHGVPNQEDGLSDDFERYVRP